MLGNLSFSGFSPLLDIVLIIGTIVVRRSGLFLAFLEQITAPCD